MTILKPSLLKVLKQADSSPPENSSGFSILPPSTYLHAIPRIAFGGKGFSS